MVQSFSSFLPHAHYVYHVIEVFLTHMEDKPPNSPFLIVGTHETE